MITPETLGALLNYAPETGKLFWVRRPNSMFSAENYARTWNTRYAEREAASLGPKGYMRIRVLGKNYAAHRVVWALAYGQWPVAEIDHINGDRADNRLVNLRSVTGAENMRNQRRSKANKSGHTGVRVTRYGTWEAYIGVAGEWRQVGTFSTLDAAATARKIASKGHGFHPNHGTIRAERTDL